MTPTRFCCQHLSARHASTTTTHVWIVVEACFAFRRGNKTVRMSRVSRPKSLKIPKIPKADNNWRWALSLKSAFLCGGFLAQAICPLWGAKPAWFCAQVTWVSSWGLTHFWEAFGFCPTSTRAYKACVGCISCRCGTESNGFPEMGRTRGGNSRRLRTKPCMLGSPKRTNSLCGKSPT